jgi:hypothetical protein
MLEFQKMNDPANPSPNPEHPGEHHMKLHRTLLALLATLATTALPLAAQTKDFSQHIVWRDAGQLSARFIPSAMLDGADLKELPLHGMQLTDLVNRLENERRLRLQGFAEGQRCDQDSEAGLSTWTSLTGKDIGVAQYLSSKALAFQGIVMDVVPGWKTGFGARPVTLVYIQIGEILACDLGYLQDTRRVEVGNIVAVEMDKASFEINGLRVCNETDDILAVPKAGDEVVATGVPSAFDPHYAGPGAIFPIHLGEILPQPYEGLGRREPVALAQAQEDLGVALTPLTSCEGLVP